MEFDLHGAATGLPAFPPLAISRASGKRRFDGETDDRCHAPWTSEAPTALLVLADGTVIEGRGLGATGSAVAEVCFNTALTGYQEILTDPSYAGQIVTFTFPHIGNVGANGEDIEDLNPAARAGAVGAIFRADITNPSNYRAAGHLDQWLKRRGIVALRGIDTRALTALIREKGMPNARHRARAGRQVRHRRAEAAGQSLVRPGRPRPRQGGHLRPVVGLDARRPGSGTKAMATGRSRRCTSSRSTTASSATSCACSPASAPRSRWFRPRPAPTTSWRMQPDGIFLSNGPGDPAATGEYAVPVIQNLLETDMPVFGICLGHQMLALALGGKTEKMHQGHHGANHPVKDHTTGKVEIVSMNHGFAVDAKSLPEGVEETHVSLFDGSNCGIALTGRPVFSVQHHPEARPARRIRTICSAASSI